MTLIDKNLQSILQEEWLFTRKIVKILSPIENITVKRGPNYLTASSAIVLREFNQYVLSPPLIIKTQYLMKSKTDQGM